MHTFFQILSIDIFFAAMAQVVLPNRGTIMLGGFKNRIEWVVLSVPDCGLS